MQTEIEAINSARTQYRAAYWSMAGSSARWHLCQGTAGVVLLSEPCEQPKLVANVHAMTEQTMVNALSAALRRNA